METWPVAHYGSPSTGTRTLSHLQLVTFETDKNYSIRNEKNTIRTALFNRQINVPLTALLVIFEIIFPTNLLTG